VNSHNNAVVRDALLCSSLGDQVAVGTLDPATRSSMWKAPQPIGRVVIHPSSTLSTKHDLARTRSIVLYHSLNVTSKPFIRDVSAVSAVGMMLFGTGFAVHHVEASVTLVDDITVHVDAQTAVLIKALRAAVHRDMALRIAQPSASVNARLLEVVARALKDNDTASRR
jgi:hypothetical protein